MVETIREQKSQELNKFLDSIASDMLPDERSVISERVKILYNIYQDGFHHHYSSVYTIIASIAEDELKPHIKRTTEGIDTQSPQNMKNLDFLTNNLKSIRDFIFQECETNPESPYADEGLANQIDKLFDHVNLEMAQYKNDHINDGKLATAEQQLFDYKKELEVRKLELERLETNITMVSQDTKTAKNDTLTMVSIFAAVVITFSGSFSFISSAIASMNTTPVHKTALVILIAGIILFNVVFLLFYMSAKLINKNIFSKCESEWCSCDGGKPKCGPLKRFYKRLPYVFFGNLVIIICFFFVLIGWSM